MTSSKRQPYRTSRLRRFGLSFLAIGLAGFVGLNLLARSHARSMMTYSESGERTAKPEELSTARRLQALLTGVNLPRPHGTATPRDRGLIYTDLFMPGPDSIRLASWYIPVEESDTLVLLFHGYGADKTSLLTELVGFHDLGYSTLAVDFRGSGGSSESYTTIGYHEAEDVAAAVRYALREFQPDRLILFGQSMGAAAILRSIEALGVEADALIIEAVFDSMLTTVCNRFDAMSVPAFPSAQLLVFWGGRRAGFNGFHHNPRDYAMAVDCPTLVLHGEGDPRARLDEARRVYDAIPSFKTFRVFGRAGHESYATLQPDAWRSCVQEFLIKPERP